MSASPLSETTIGVIVVNYNSGAYLRQCLLSLIHSSIDLSIVVIDNASSDGSAQSINDIAESLANSSKHRLNIISSEKNLGFAKAVNFARQHLVNIDALALINPDCCVHPDTFLGLYQTLTKHSNRAMVGPIVFNENGTEQRGGRRFTPTLKRNLIKGLGLQRRFAGIDLNHQAIPTTAIKVEAISGAAMLMDITTFDAIGGMDEDYFLHCEDLDLCKRVTNYGKDIIFLPSESVIHHQGASSGVSNWQVARYKHQSMALYIDKHCRVSSNAVMHAAHHLLIGAHRGMDWLKHQRPNAANNIPKPISPSLPGILNWRQQPNGNVQASVLVTGATTTIGAALLPRLVENGFRVIAISRQIPLPSSTHKNLIWLSHDYLEKAPTKDLGPIDHWINLAPIWTVQHWLERLPVATMQSIIAFSSTSVLSKAHSDHAKEKAIVAALSRGENTLIQEAKEQRVQATIFRPTLIYSDHRDQNVQLIKRWIRCLRFFPIVGEASGLRSPVHADDLAYACIQVLQLPTTSQTQQIYQLSGADTLSYRTMVERIFAELQIKPRFIRIPAAWLATLLNGLSKLPGLAFLTANMADRMNQHLDYDHQQATKDFAYSPRGFLTQRVNNKNQK